MNIKKKIVHILKHNGFLQSIYIVIVSAFFKLLGLFIPINNELVLMNGHGYKYNDSPRAIYEKMVESGLAKKFRIVWALNDIQKYDFLKCEKVEMDTFRYFLYALQAKYWISCVNIERALHFKKKKTVYLNTWHGALINLCGNAVGTRKDFKWDYVDYFCSCSDFETPLLVRDFGLKEKSILKVGYPRNDELYKAGPDKVISIKNKLGIPVNKKVILYAPTWRDSSDGGVSFNLIPPVDFLRWKEKLGEDYVVLLRTHPYTTKLMNIEFDDFVMDYTNYPSVNDLLIVSDFLISDYSSILLDYSILEKPIICFGYDYDEYKKTRGFYYELETEIPNGVMKDENVILDYILTSNYKDECLKVRKFKKNHMQYGGNATEVCIQKLFQNGEKND